MRALGTQVVRRCGNESVSRRAAIEHAQATGRRWIDRSTDPDWVAGLGTFALELLEQCSSPVDILYVPVGTGATIVGTATVFRMMSPRTRVIGVQAEGAAATTRAWRTGEARRVRGAPTLADALAVENPVANLVERMADLVDEMVTVNEREIARAMRTYAAHFHQLAEGGSAAALAAVVRHRSRHGGRRIVAALTGGNVGDERLVHIARGSAA
jgi:threonine dehydratase